METLEIYEQMAVKIIAVQEAIIGPLAVDQAKKVSELTIEWDNKIVHIDGNGKNAIQSLIQVYKQLFGLNSVEVSKDAVSSLSNLLSAEQVPELLSA